MRRIRSHKLAAGLVITILAAAVCAATVITRTSASGPILKRADNAPAAKRTASALTPAFLLGPETTTFNGSYSDAPNPQACGTRHNFTVAAGKVRIVVTAAGQVPTNDIVLNLYSSAGDLLGTSDTATSPEGVVYQPTGGVPAGTYKVEVCPYDDPAAPPTAPYSYSGTFTTDDTTVPSVGATPTPSPVATPTPGPAPIAPRYHEYAPPAAMGENSGEPSIGFNVTTKRAMYIAGLQTLQITFPDRILPLGSVPDAGPAEWKDVSFATTKVRSLDPILFTDQRTGRTFVSQLNSISAGTLIGANSLMAYTDDDGANWTPAQLNLPDGSNDHQTVGAGPYPSSLSGLRNDLNKGSAVYYCGQMGNVLVATSVAVCSRSDDGGLNFGKSIPVYPGAPVPGGCSQLIHGHVKVAPDGTVYLPNAQCGGKQAVAVSTDAGTTWTVRQIPNTFTPSGILDPSVAISNDPPVAPATSNTIYVGFTGRPTASSSDNHAYVAVSKDRGLTWSAPYDLGASVGVQNAVFAQAVAGDANRAAVAFLGTTTPGNHQDAGFKGTWYGFVAHTYDGGLTWTTVNATPNGPVQREACIWNGGGNNPCRNLLDFNDITMDDKGRVLFAYADGCIDQCEKGGANSYSSKATVARQSGGKGLLGVYDTPEPALPQRPYLKGFRDDMASYLTWNAPDHGGSPITAYKIYRSAAGGPEVYIGQTSGDDDGYNDRGVSAGVTTYRYRVTAVNAIGESLYSNDVSLLREARREQTGSCEKPGITAILDPADDASTRQASHDITSVSVSEPIDTGDPTGKASNIVFTIKVADLATVPPGWRWSMRLLIPGYGPPAAVGVGAQEDWFVSMTSSDGAAPAFTFGTTGVPTVQNQTAPGRFFTTLGALHSSSSVAANGTITLVLPKEAIRSRAVCGGTCAPLGPGQAINLTLGSVRATAPSQLPSAGGTNETIPDTTGAGTYSLRPTNLCLPNTAPLAQLTANVDEGLKPLAVQFNGSASSDADSIDTIASYTFNFGDGSDDVTQTSPTINHTFTEAGEYPVRLVVTDSRGKVSSNTSQFLVEVNDVVTCTPSNMALASLGSFATASSSYSTLYSAGSAIDGEHRGLNWGNNGGWNDATRGVYPDSLEVAFNGAQKLTEIRVFTVQNDFRNPVEPDANTLANVYGIQDFQVQYWDGTQWVTVPNGGVIGNDKAMRVFTFPEITTTKIRIFVTNARNNFSRLTEVEAIGCPAAP